MARHWIDLSDAELALLDGKVEDIGAQCVVAAAKARIVMIMQRPDVPRHIAELAADVVTSAKANLILSAGSCHRRQCDRYGFDAGHHPYTRTGRHKKGTPNLSRPRAIDCMKSGGIVCCKPCWDAAIPVVLAALENYAVEISSQFGVVCPYKRVQHIRCKACLYVGPCARVAWAAARQCAKCKSYETSSTDSYSVINVHAEAAIESLAAMAS